MPNGQRILQCWLTLLRGREHDRRKAWQASAETGRREREESLAEYNAFVPVVRGITEGLLLGQARASSGEELLIRLPWDEAYHHWIIQGGTGTGKTTWVSALLAQELARDRPFGVIDCKGDLFRTMIRTLAVAAEGRSPPEREKLFSRLVVINPFTDDLVPLNVCRPIPGFAPEVQAYELTLALGRLFDSAMGVHMESMLRQLIILAIESNLTLVEIPLLLQNELLRDIIARRSPNAQTREFFLQTFPVMPQQSKDALLSRIQSLLLAENVRLMLGANDLIDLKELLDSGKIFLAFLGKGLGVPEEQVQVLGSLLLQLLLQAAYGREHPERSFLLAADEFFHLFEAPGLAQRLETALTTIRSFGIFLMLIHHNFVQLPTSLREIMLSNCDLISLFRTGGRTGEHFGEFLPDVDPETLDRGTTRGELRKSQRESLQRLPAKHFYWYDRRKPYRAIRLQAPEVLPPHELLEISTAALERKIREGRWDRGSHVRSRSVLRRELADRAAALQSLLRPSPSKAPPRRRQRPELG